MLLDYIDNKQIEKIVRAERIKDMKLPSPYLDGVFDNLMKEHPEVLWNPTLETDRGCPTNVLPVTGEDLLTAKFINLNWTEYLLR